LSLAARQREEDMVAPGERYSVEERTGEIEAIVLERGEVTFTELLGSAPTLGWAVVTFIALLDLYRRVVIDLEQNELFTDIVIRRKEPRAQGSLST
jgi:chromatin segregation and condensation protein Rec8/ScpA/Scc1 (kleisin family)